ncbi:TPA: hypothetical protein TZS69_000417 [Streptococcus suis]|nr:hypothetical protein [Streptococcus suis]
MFKFLINVVSFSLTDMIRILTFYITVWGVATTIFDFKEFKFYYLIFIVSLFIVLITLLIKNFFKLKSKKLHFDFNSTRKFSILLGDYLENMQYISDKKVNAEQNTLFVVGLDQSGLLENASNGSVLSDLLKLLEQEGINRSDLQNQLNECVKSQLNINLNDSTQKLALGDIVLVKFKASLKFRTSNILPILFVVNSFKTAEGLKYNDLDNIKGIDSRKIIIDIYSKFHELKQFDRLFLGAIGTNKLKFPYSILINEVITGFAFAVANNFEIKQVYFSIREIDMENQFLDRGNLINQATSLLKYYSNNIS